MQGVSPNSSDGHESPSGRSSTVVLMTMADTTWRMFVPSIGCTFLGIWLDSKWQTTPWLMFAGILLGFTVASLAVWLQYRKIV